MKKLFILWLIVAACTKVMPTLNGIDLTPWQDDKFGCHHIREKSIDTLMQQLQKLNALSESQVAELLGRPDKIQLYQRNQKFYYYFLQPSASCTPSQEKSKQLIIRFNGMRVAKDIVIGW